MRKSELRQLIREEIRMLTERSFYDMEEGEIYCSVYLPSTIAKKDVSVELKLQRQLDKLANTNRPKLTTDSFGQVRGSLVCSVYGFDQDVSAATKFAKQVKGQMSDVMRVEIKKFSDGGRSKIVAKV